MVGTVKESPNRRKSAMTMPALKAKARTLGLHPGRKNKCELIHAVQAAENNVPCYGMSHGDCHQDGCCFYKDCLRLN
jgi:hypothetical protein